MITRQNELDGLRGVAAFAVVISHIAALQWVPFIDRRPAPDAAIYLMWHLGAPAVVLFFVLSGYVVCGSLLKTRSAYGPFVIGRYVRLLPIAWVGVAAGMLLRHFAATLPAGMSGSLQHAHRALHLSDLVSYASMIAPVPDAAMVNPPLWSLFVEIQVAFAMPLLAAAARRRPALLAVAGIVMCISAGVLTGTAYPLLFAGFFVGAAYAGLEKNIQRSRRPAALLLVALGILLLRTWLNTDDEGLRPVCALGALGVIIAVKDGSGKRFLKHPCVQWLGKISYPLYATHYPVIAFAAIAGASSIGLIAAAILSVPAALCLAALLQWSVDAPSVAISGKVRRLLCADRLERQRSSWPHNDSAPTFVHQPGNGTLAATLEMKAE